MNRFFVVVYEGKIHCTPATKTVIKRRGWPIITKINKFYNAHNVQIVLNYFEQNSHHYMLDILEGK
jgi:hypothetical protein